MLLATRGWRAMAAPKPTPRWACSPYVQAMSMWLAAACVASNEACKKQAAGLLATLSTRERLERVIKAQKAAVGKKYASGKSR